MFAHGRLRVVALAAALALVAPAALYAGGGGGRGGGGGGGGRGGGGYGGGYGRGGYGYGGYGRGGYGYGGYGGYGRGYWGGYGRGYWGGGYGYGFWPYYGFGFGWPYYGGGFYDYDYPPDYPPYYPPYAAAPPGSLTGPPANSAALVGGSGAPTAATRSFYPPDVETGPAPLESDRALVTVRLPADATLSFQGTEMPLTGPERVFRSPPLTLGKTYRYDVTVRWTENGKPVEKNRSITVQAGQRTYLDVSNGD